MVNPWMMRLEEALNSEGIPADPGRARFVPDQHYCEDITEVVEQLKGRARAFGSGKHMVVLVDGIPKRCADGSGADLDGRFRETLIAEGFSVDWIVLSEAFGIDPSGFHSSYSLVEKTREVVRSARPDFFVVLGSGSITDVVKHAMFLEERTEPFIAVPTALTVTAFTSAFAIIDFHGAKRTQLSREVSTTFWVESILECAPQRMSRAGYGDLLARFVAYGDWYLGRRLGVMDRYDETALRLMEPFAKAIKSIAPGFSAPVLPKETCRVMAAALAMAGIAMSVSGETTPLSGFEHVISHGLDFLRLTSGRELVFHGEQVGLACLTSAKAIDWLLRQDISLQQPWMRDPEVEGMTALNRLIGEAPFFGGDCGDTQRQSVDFLSKVEKARQEFATEYRKKSLRWAQEKNHIEDFIVAWPEIRAHLAQITMRLEEMVSLAERSGLPMVPGETTPPTSDAEFLWAVRFSPFVRNRANIADLVFWMGEDLTGIVYGPENPSP
jgi:glycerol-1-phosphate dehydrogenase [NAD(P)+]